MYRKVLEWPTPSLSTKSSPVVKGKSEDIISDLKDSFRVTGGLGLAAPQIGFKKRALVISPVNLSISSDEMLVMINPELELSGDKFDSHEACFSIPYISHVVPRYSQCLVRFYNEDWEEQELKVEGLASACIQHEVDHLDGILYIRRIKSPFKRSSLLKKLKKHRKAVKEKERQAKDEFERDHLELMSGNFNGQKTSKKTHSRKRKPKPRRKIKRAGIKKKKGKKK